MADAERVAMTVEIPRETHKGIRTRAIEEGRHTWQLVADALNAYLAKNGAPATNGGSSGPRDGSRQSA